MTGPAQGDGTHLSPGSVQTELNRLGALVRDQRERLFTAERRIRLLEGGLRDCLAGMRRAESALAGDGTP